jgi:hypothetical protein
VVIQTLARTLDLDRLDRAQTTVGALVTEERGETFFSADDD